MKENEGKGIVTLSFDDGRRDSFDVFMDILKPMRIPATINIPTGYIEVGFSDPTDIGYNGLMTKAQLDEISSCPLFEIAGHGHMHNNSDADVEMGIKKLKEWYPSIKEFGFASPHSDLSDEDVLGKRDFFQSIGIRYVRLGRNFTKRNLYKRILSKIASKSGEIAPFRKCYKSSLNDPNRKIIHAIPIIKTTRIEQVKTIIDYAISKREWCVLEIHGIDQKDSVEYQELFCWDRELFVTLCEYLVKLRSDGLILLKRTIDVVNSETSYRK